MTHTHLGVVCQSVASSIYNSLRVCTVCTVHVAANVWRDSFTCDMTHTHLGVVCQSVASFICNSLRRVLTSFFLDLWRDTVQKRTNRGLFCMAQATRRATQKRPICKWIKTYPCMKRNPHLHEKRPISIWKKTHIYIKREGHHCQALNLPAPWKCTSPKLPNTTSNRSESWKTE